MKRDRKFKYAPFPKLYGDGGQALLNFKGSIAIEAPGIMNAEEQERLGERFAKHLEEFMCNEDLLQFTFITTMANGLEHLAHSYTE